MSEQIYVNAHIVNPVGVCETFLFHIRTLYAISKLNQWAHMNPNIDFFPAS